MSQKLVNEIKQSEYFDADWYVNEYPDVKEMGICPAEHYAKYGWRMGRSPSIKFCGKKYWKFHSDVMSAGLNPLQHYLEHGVKEGRAVFSNEQLESNVNQSVSRLDELDWSTQIMLMNQCNDTANSQYESALTEYKKLEDFRSEDGLVRDVKTIPADWPKDLKLRPLPDSTNDYEWHKKYGGADKSFVDGLSVIVATYNRSHIVAITLAALVNQETEYDFEVVVADDGSQEDIANVVRSFEGLLDIIYVRQEDDGFRKSAITNLGFRAAKYSNLAVLDCDMAPCPNWVQSNMDVLADCNDIAVIGPRKYIDTSSISIEEVLSDGALLERTPEVVTYNDVAGHREGKISIDWRLKSFSDTDDLRLCDSPFRFFSGGNIAFHRKWFDKTGGFDEEFKHWGGEDNEFGYRLYRAGCFFKSVIGAMAYHQEPPGKENETDRAGGKKITETMRYSKMPFVYRKLDEITDAKIYSAPLVSIYIPAYNCEDTIVRCVLSALNQTVVDLEICICDDGSTDRTLAVIEENFGDNPRVKFTSKVNGGIGAASNSAVKLTSGFYIGQLDSDDYLEPDAVKTCLNVFLKNQKLACVYTTNRNVDPDGKLIANGYNWPVFSREKFTSAMIAHHFRMFTARAWNLTTGFNEKITNAVDYDMYLKLSEIGPFKHVNKICYNRVLHGENTSIKKLGIQKINHFAVVNNSLGRQGVTGWDYQSVDAEDSSRKYKFVDKGLV